MKLTVLTPTAIVLDVEGVSRLRATDATGDFGVRPGHGDFVTLLEPSIVEYTQAGATRFVAAAGGILTVERGSEVKVLCEEAVSGDDLHVLETTALEAFRRRTRTEQAATTGLARLHVALMRQLESFLRPGVTPAGTPGLARREAET
jgi:F-type H+-transporting ATPase subunit epsilon